MVDRLRPLIDADMLRYEVGFGVEHKDEDGKLNVLGMDAAISLLERKVEEIMDETWATDEPIFYLTADEKLIDKLNIRRIKWGKKPLVYEPNFRDDIAVTKKYKGTRSGNKPTHYNNLTAYILARYKTKLAIGMEADDLISIHQNIKHKKYETIICSRDKDLRITPGKHYGWSCGKQPSFGPIDVTSVGTLDKNAKGKVTGTGLKFFYAQMIMGDTVDNIPGLYRKGPAFAYDLLSRCRTEKGYFTKVTNAYKEQFKNSDIDWREYFKEQAALLWMVQSLDEEGNLVHYKMFDER